MIYLLAGLAALLLVWIILYFNKMVRLSNHLSEAHSNIDVQLKKRMDLIPNLVEIAKSYGVYEKTTLEEVVKLRSGEGDQEQTERLVSKGLKSLLVLVEDYPDIKADEVYNNLFKQLVEVEEAIQLTRRYYNGTVREFNIAKEVFPNVLLAGLFGYTQRHYLEFETATEKINFSEK